jgi:hypothetical protein
MISGWGVAQVVERLPSKWDSGFRTKENEKNPKKTFKNLLYHYLKVTVSRSQFKMRDRNNSRREK